MITPNPILGTGLHAAGGISAMPLKEHTGLSIYHIIIGVSLLIAMSAFNRVSQSKPFFPTKYPGKPTAILGAKKIVLSNDALFVEWELQQGVINLIKATNKYDNTTVDLRGIIQFAIELENGK